MGFSSAGAVPPAIPTRLTPRRRGGESQRTVVAAGPPEVLAGDITAPTQVQIVNPELYLLTIDDDDATLHVELTVERGKGYAPIDQRETLDIGTIPIDALFAPVRRANYVIERTRVGPMKIGRASCRERGEVWRGCEGEL